jgi:hypothetical protein
VEQTCPDSNNRQKSTEIYGRGKGVPVSSDINNCTDQGCCFSGKQYGDVKIIQATAEMIFSAWTHEEEIVQGLLNQWGKGAHGFVPVVKEDDIVQLGCENMNSLRMYNQKESKMRRILNLHREYQTDGACILQHGTNFSMSQEGNRANDLFTSIPGSCMTAAHNSAMSQLADASREEQWWQHSAG